MKTLITLFLCGDVMLGRGIDQIMPVSVDPTLHEPHVKDARRYVELAEKRFAEIPDDPRPKYVWGEALDALEAIKPDVRIINLETAVTTSAEHDRDKGIHYRMHPDNIGIINAAKVDVCVLANNHVLDWGPPGLRETLDALRKADLKSAGAGANDDDAEKPAVLHLSDKHDARILIFSFATPDSGVARGWAAGPGRPGVNFLANLSDQSFDRAQAVINEHTRDEANDIIVFSIHWGGNWGYDIPEAQRRFAHRLIDEAGVDVVHGHSSHHAKGIEIYQNRPVFYGCGDFLNDYEGIAGHEKYRPDLALMYLPTIQSETGELEALRLRPMRIRHFRLNKADAKEAAWLKRTLNRESEPFDVEFTIDESTGDLIAQWE